MADLYYNNVVLLLDGEGTNNSSTFTDLSSAPNTIGVSGSAIVSTAQSQFSTSSIYLNGSGSYLTAPNSALLSLFSSDFTVELSTYIATLPSAYKRIISYCKPSVVVGTDEGLIVEIDTTNRISFGVNGTDGLGYYITDPTVLSINTWVSWALVRKGNRLTLYKNGTSIGTTIISVPVANSATHQLYIGRFPNVVARDYNGYIDNLRITKKVARYTSNYTASTTPFDIGLPIGTVDPHYYNTSLLLHNNGSNNDTLILDNSPRPKYINPVGTAKLSSTVAKFGTTSLAFNGALSYVAVQSNAGDDLDLSSGSYTVEAWMNFSALSTNDYQLLLGAGFKIYPNRWVLDVGITSGLITLRLVTESNAVLFSSTPAAYTLNTWVHIAYVNNTVANTFTMFVNGVTVGQRVATSLGYYSSLQLGESYTTVSQPSTYYIDDFRITKNVARYTGTFTPSATSFYNDSVVSVGDSFFNNSLLLHCNDSIFSDASYVTKYITPFGNANVNNTQSKFGGFSGYFDGTGDYLSIPHTQSLNLTTGNWTVELWFRSNATVSTSGGQILLGKDGKFNLSFPQYRLLISATNKLEGCTGYGNGVASTLINYTGTTNITPNVWHHAALVCVGTTVSLYLDGVLEASGVKYATMADGGKPLIIGYETDQPATLAFNGYIDEVCITKGVARYTSTFTPSTTAFTDLNTFTNNNSSFYSAYVNYIGNSLTTFTPTNTDANVNSGQIIYKGSVLHIVAQTLRGGLAKVNNPEPTSSPYLTPAMSEFGVDYWFPHANDTTYLKTNVDVVNNLPIAMNNNYIGTTPQIAISYLQDFYYRVHSSISSLALGNVLSEQVFQIQIWNAWFVNDILTSIDNITLPDVLLTLPLTLPKTFTPLQYVNGTITVAAIGTPTISGSYNLTFTNQLLTIPVVGQRVLVWPFLPNTDFSENKEWLTDVLPSRHGEQRLAVRELPRMNLNYKFVYRTTKEYALAKQLSARMAHLAAGTPLWSDITPVTNLVVDQTIIYFTTTNLEYRVNSIVIFWDSYDLYEVGEVSEVYSDRIILKQGLKAFHSKCWVAPILIGYIPGGINLSRDEKGRTTGGIGYKITDTFNSPAWTTDTFLGLPVMTASSVVTGGLAERFARDVEVFDSVAGNFAQFDVEDYTRHSQTIIIKTRSVAELYTARRMFDYLKGKYTPFWLPSYNNDLIADTDLLIGASSIRVKFGNWSTYPSYYVRITGKTLAGAAISSYFTVTGATNNYDGTEAIGLSPAVTTTIVSISRIDVMKKVRLDADTIEFSHSSKRITTIKTVVIEIL